MFQAVICGHIHESEIWEKGAARFEGKSAIDYFQQATDTILKCPHTLGGQNILCAHARTIDSKENYRIILKKQVQDTASLTQEQKQELLHILQNLFTLIDALDQAVRFSYAGGPVLEIRYDIDWKLLPPQMHTEYEALWAILEQNGLHIFLYPEAQRVEFLHKRTALCLEQRKKFQNHVFALQKMILQQYHLLFPSMKN